MLESQQKKSNEMQQQVLSDRPINTQTSLPTKISAAPSEKVNIKNEAPSVVKQPKRQGYLSWDDYFLSVAILSSKRSKDPKSASGACIVDQKKRIVGIGYNGFPRGCSDSVFPWTDSSPDCDWLHTKHPWICDAVSNAILNKCTNDVAGACIYVMEFPNSESAKVIIQSGIEEVVILGDQMVPSENEDADMEVQAARIMLEMANVRVRYCKPSASKLTLDFASKMVPTTTGCEEVTSPEQIVLEEEKRQKEVEKQRVARDTLLEEANYDSSKVSDNGKSKDFISWQDYFMAMAFLTAQRSKDPNTQVGACIVDEESRIIGLGYNGFPSGCSDDLLPWARSNSNSLHNKYLYVCHAEVNAILNKGSANVKGATIYVALFPCQNCAKMIIQAGIREVVFMSDAYHDTPGCRASRTMFRCAGVKLRQYIPSMQELVL
eukprot:CAMPEP_0176033302 /NCGR_PEP_ID=MMETSP0120_2-20121206/16447_1 /TAXON_ID=160619 /ORGANISM="Kryptoperidinium foliaceum, Strain CCMP 1326" /LENGTH=433 /DNA_ID=CAMNT_0017366627 /DNA_START=235 /DNA_END=1533 /DNA_ORIENTATION=-